MTDPLPPDVGPVGRPADRAPVPPDVCLRCGGRLESLGVHDFRTGGTSGGWKLVFGELAELGEDMFPFEVLACRACNHAELRLTSGG